MEVNSPSVEYLSIGANRYSSVADWAYDILAFGADINVALWQPHDIVPRGIGALLSGHTSAVRAVKFIHRSEDERFLVTAGDDQTLKVWSIGENLSYRCLQTAHEHKAAVNCIAVLKTWGQSCSAILVASGASDGTIKIWKFESRQLDLLQTITTSPKYFPLDLALAIPNSENDGFILAAAGTRDFVQIFAASSTDDKPQFQHQATLQGHEGWIRSLDFVLEKEDGSSDLFLASASQDKYIRLWRVHKGESLPALSAAASAADPLVLAYLPGKSPSNKAHRLQVGSHQFSISFEALLLGHEDWIYRARWSRRAGKLCLLSTSADNSLSIWEADPASGIWVTTARLGEISREKGATTATGSIGGFWTGLWSPDGKSVVCLGRTGSWRRWHHDDDVDDQWKPAMTVTGHTKPVTGIAWSKSGHYLLSTSSDQTTRLHAAWLRDEDDGSRTWHEMSRPQIHGYDLNCIDSLGDSRFVSGADEKLMRVFDEPRAVAKLLNELGNKAIVAQEDMDALPDMAQIPVLGLSNKAADGQQEPGSNGGEPADTNGAESADGAAATTTAGDGGGGGLRRPPFEDALSRRTLWPEAEKLYGHGYELSCLATSHGGDLVASACRASSANHAVIRLFETRGWTEIRPPLTAHSLTATRLRFAPPDDAFLLSVGRDRQWAVFERSLRRGGEEKECEEKEKQEEEEVEKEKGTIPGTSPTYRPLQSNPKGHSRMILDAAWAPFLGEGGAVGPGDMRRAFATAGRDKQVKIWVGEENAEGKMEFAMATSISGDSPVTAVDFLPVRNSTGHYVLAAGNEAGKISLYTLDSKDFKVVSMVDLEERYCLAKAVLQLAWRPAGKERQEPDGHCLAIAGDDSSLRIYGFEEL